MICDGLIESSPRGIDVGIDDGNDRELFSVLSRPSILIGGKEVLYSGGLSNPIDDRLYSLDALDDGDHTKSSFDCL